MLLANMLISMQQQGFLHSYLHCLHAYVDACSIVFKQDSLRDPGGGWYRRIGKILFSEWGGGACERI
jgi:hypothetical protein